MLNNYDYFIVIAEELNISNAAKRLFISHQCLSKYLKNLEERYNVTFFDRKPKLKLTTAGEIMLQTLRNIELLEKNLENQLSDINETNSGTIHFGIPEGRYSIIVPKLLKAFRDIYPNVDLVIHHATSLQMQDMILENSLDLFLSGISNLSNSLLKYDIILNEKMYLIISDNLLKKSFPENYPQCKETFKNGVDLKLFEHVPFVLNKKNFNSRILLDNHLKKLGITLNCINELTQPDIHYLLCAEDYAASFCFSMYLSGINQLNKFSDNKSLLNVFPIIDLDEVSPLALIYHKNKIFPSYINDFKRILKNLCNPYSNESNKKSE
ncbi:MAG: LysR family transcriptional regulator [Fusobacteriaceae bacterium]|nr:LysR family transcriptional regulator [Fusobacteriaceae bacterium]MBN2838196.1 LysR family transcriptional regulator [Fusobacteriaceae bacterium]